MKTNSKTVGKVRDVMARLVKAKKLAEAAAHLYGVDYTTAVMLEQMAGAAFDDAMPVADRPATAPVKCGFKVAN